MKGPATSLDILGILFESRKEDCFISVDKAIKYTQRLKSLLGNNSSTPTNIEKIVGNLVYAAWVIPFGRPFTSHISHFINRKNE